MSEKRVDPWNDGFARTYDEFENYYIKRHSKSAIQALWNQCLPERRIDPVDGVAYTFQELHAWYAKDQWWGSHAIQQYWDAAKDQQYWDAACGAAPREHHYIIARLRSAADGGDVMEMALACEEATQRSNAIARLQAAERGSNVAEMEAACHEVNTVQRMAAAVIRLEGIADFNCEMLLEQACDEAEAAGLPKELHLLTAVRNKAKSLRTTTTLDPMAKDEDAPGDLQRSVPSRAIVIVTLQGNRFPMRFDETDTVRNVKASLEKTWDIPARFQELILDDVALKDEVSLKASGIQEDTVLTFVRKRLRSTTLPIKVKPINAPEIHLRVNLSDTVGELKVMIRDSHDDAIPEERQRLIFAGRVLNDSSTLESYGMSIDACVTLV